MTLGQLLLAALDSILPPVKPKHVRPISPDSPSRVPQDYRGAGKRRSLVPRGLGVAA